RVDLPSFAATSVIKVKDRIYVATGNLDGGVVEIDTSKKLPKDIVHFREIKHALYELDDARYLDYDQKHIYCVKGTDAGLWVLDRKSKASELIHLNGATIPES